MLGQSIWSAKTTTSIRRGFAARPPLRRLSSLGD
jgi:hypothetical protein